LPDLVEVVLLETQDQEEVYLEGNWIFALDIGTRSVVGLVAQKDDDDSIKIVDMEVKEHPERSMVGGQIHDVPKVAKTISHIKHSLEARLGFQLGGAAVAAAGRSLLTTFSRAEMTFPYPQEISDELFYTLQLEAVRQAQYQIREIDKTCDYHCVGFSICHQYLDEAVIGNLVGQIGKVIAVEIIATFLPRIVIDSLHGALQKAGLDMAHITLEPIAALNLAVPDNMRQLNIALVDIGAGTSDIAISEGGSVRGYGMIPMAGDEITESICQHYLLDFINGETVKRQLSSGADTVSFTDIIGLSHSVAVNQVIETIEPTISVLVQRIAEKILEVNGRPPQAVLCIGGGSLSPAFPRKLALALGLPENRVAVISSNVTEPVTSFTDRLSSAEAVTPLAIAVDGLTRSSLSIFKVSVNGRPIRLFAANELTVGDALVAAGIPPSQYLGRIGPAIAVEINGEVVFIKGEPGQMGKVAINGKPGELTTAINEGDTITFEPGTIGKPGQGQIKDILPKQLEGKELSVKLNSIPVDDYELPFNDGDKIEFTILDREIQIAEKQVPRNQGFKQETGSVEYLPIMLNGQAMNIPLSKGKSNPILTDLFAHIDLDPKAGIGKKLLMEVNGAPANFITPLKAGDHINLKWI
jgi:cell division protein FtsA